MTYDLYIIQLPFLPERPKKPLEKLFRAFDQRYKVENDSKFLELTEDEDETSDFNVVFRRLFHAASDEKLRGDLDLEDYVHRMWTIEQAEKEDLKDELKETKVELTATKQQLAEQQNQLAETKNQLSAMIKLSASLGASPDKIASQLSIPIDEVNRVLEKF
ncbi:MAG: hypothetical protein IJ150_13135 [Bacteroidales bacterium]|nr:hypothetical protein [Bacteroidales bacterium]